MLGRLRALDPARSVPGILFYGVVKNAAWLALRLLLGLRVLGAEKMPRNGGVLVVLNHQSHLDVMLVGASLPRHVVYLARATLFKNRLFGWFIRMLNAVPLKQSGADTAAIRAALEQLERGRVVLIFPEGTRTEDGGMRPFKRGVWLLLSRAKCPVLPVGIDGAFDAWPRGRGSPRLLSGCRVEMQIGEPIDAASLLAMGPDAGLAHLGRVIDGLRLEARGQMRRATDGSYPPAGAGDGPMTAADGADVV